MADKNATFLKVCDYVLVFALCLLFLTIAYATGILTKYPWLCIAISFVLGFPAGAFVNRKREA